MATVVKNFRIKSGLVVEGATGTINGQNILTETGSDEYILNLVGGATLVKSVDTEVFNVDNAGNLTVNANTFDSYGSAADALSDANSYTDGEITTALSTAQGYANTAESNAISAASSDATSKANQALLDAQTYANTAASNAQSSAETYADSLASNYDPAGAAYDAQIAAAQYTDAAISNEVTARDAAIATAKGEATAYTDTAVANLVDGAPELLDTLNELAAAIADNPNYATDVANLVATKADTSYVDSEISNVDSAAEGYAATAETNAKSYADGLAINYDTLGAADTAQQNAEDYADGLVNNLLDATTPFTDLNINDVAKQVASRVTSLGSVTATAYQFNKSSFKSGKFLVKIDNGTHNEVSEILVTLDSSDNVAITEYAIVGTNGSRGTITADVDATHCRIRVTPVNDSTITVAGTIFNS